MVAYERRIEVLSLVFVRYTVDNTRHIGIALVHTVRAIVVFLYIRSMYKLRLMVSPLTRLLHVWNKPYSGTLDATWYITLRSHAPNSRFVAGTGCLRVPIVGTASCEQCGLLPLYAAPRS